MGVAIDQTGDQGVIAEILVVQGLVFLRGLMSGQDLQYTPIVDSDAVLFQYLIVGHDGNNPLGAN